VYFGGWENNPMPFDSTAFITHTGGLVALQHIAISPTLLSTYALKYNLIRIGSTIWDPIDLDRLVANH
jgi:hypothetical protein